MTPQDPFQSPPLYGGNSSMTCANSPPSTRWILAPIRAGINDYVASIEAHAAAVPAEKERLIPYVRSQLRMFQGPSEADTRPPADAR
ncbi:hypothetical protein ASF56_20195 [Methylobacterium sp. Leaf122]|nr:hypothetical protein ASF56_20195 [Methylobacterium sp. Leaf122]